MSELKENGFLTNRNTLHTKITVLMIGGITTETGSL
jgi:hypothetical protein